MGICGGKTANESVDTDHVVATVWDIFTYVKQLGVGGSCEVDLVHDTKDKTKEYALKVLKKYDESNSDLFEHEVRILKMLDHNNIVKFIDCYEDEDNYYICTQLCRGGELFDRIVDHHHFSEQVAASLTRSMLESIKYCHDRNIVHRDLKPENFVFESKAEDSELKVIDFGCAKIVEDKKRYYDLVGTPFYLAPESADPKTERNGKILKASDMWSIGVITYVMITGRPPFHGRDNQKIFDAILKGKYSYHDQDISAECKSFIDSLLKQDPYARLTVDQALNHQWINGAASDKKIAKTIIASLQNFHHQCRLKKALAKLVVDQMTADDHENIRQLFEKFDENGDGKLQKDELIQMFKTAGCDLGEASKKATQVLDVCDLDGDGSLDVKEFAQMHARKRLSVDVNAIEATFHDLDKDKSGGISEAELGEYFKSTNLSQDDIHSMLAEIDANGDGTIDLEEFKRAMQGSRLTQAAAPAVESQSTNKFGKDKASHNKPIKTLTGKF